MAKISYLSGIGTPRKVEEVNFTLEQAEEFIASVGRIGIAPEYLEDDITELSEGELERRLAVEKMQILASQTGDYQFQAAAQAIKSGSVSGISGIGAMQSEVQTFLRQTEMMNAPAFIMPKLRFTVPKGTVSGIGKFGDKIKNVISKVGDAFKAAFKGVVNFIFKKALPVASPMFFGIFILKKLKNKISQKKAEKQKKHFEWMIGKCGMTKSAGMKVIENSILAKLGKTPQQLLGKAATGGGGAETPVDKAVQEAIEKAKTGTNTGKKIKGVGALPLALIGPAIGALGDLVGKIIGLFKKKDAPDLGKEDAITEADNIEVEGSGGGSSATDGGSDGGGSEGGGSSDTKGDNTMMYVGLGVLGLGALYMMK